MRLRRTRSQLAGCVDARSPPERVPSTVWASLAPCRASPCQYADIDLCHRAQRKTCRFQRSLMKRGLSVMRRAGRGLRSARSPQHIPYRPIPPPSVAPDPQPACLFLWLVAYTRIRRFPFLHILAPNTRPGRAVASPSRESRLVGGPDGGLVAAEGALPPRSWPSEKHIQTLAL